MQKFSSHEIDSVLKQAVKKKEVPGVVAIVATDRDTVYEGAFGMRELDKEAVMTMDTVGYIASMTKPVTTVAAMQLVERGKMDLDSPAEEILPELSKVQVLERFDKDDNPVLRPAKRKITLRHLLTHTSGFGYEQWNADILKYQEVTGTSSIFTSKNDSLTIPLLFDPGERWVYGVGVDWVGKMVEAVSGKTLGGYMSENIFKPLGMSSTTFDISSEYRSRLSGIHSRKKDGSLKVIPWEFNQEYEFQQGGGGLYGTMQDYIRFTQMFLNKGSLGGEKILEPATVRLMSQNQIGDLEVCELKTVLPNYTNDANFFPEMKQKWGLGFLINPVTSPQGRSPGSIAWAGLSNCYFWIDPTKRITGVFMTQIFPFFDHLTIKLFRDFETAVYKTL